MTKAAERYAEALLELSDTQSEALTTLADCLKDADIKAFFENPAVESLKKREILQKALGSGFDPVLQSFIMLLTDKNRLDVLDQIAESYSVLAEKAKNVRRIKIYSASEVDTQQIAALKKKFSAQKAEVVTDPLLIGGVKVWVGDKVYDYSLKTMLMQMLGSEADGC